MKFLILALCVYAANAATGRYQPWQPKPVVQAVAEASVAAQPVVQTVVQPVPVAVKSVVEVGKDAEAIVLRSDSEVNPDGFNYVYETGNGITGQSSGVLKQVGDAQVLAVQGSYQYKSPEGIPVQFSYVADENGYQPQSDLLPVGPPMPEAIRRAVEYVLTHAPKESVN
ncbi:larval cuticle protein LCP-14-like [Manduca sexta]|uniref:Larval cuticle protein LCP-17-like n=1 Tax=Manduca sexta TaxID=7130 RepID=A0A922CMW9_MANSE|nr:larval cuticle protein LCP-14-like [Manduca sexta]KAG6451773.1 hypothetical protein O3G_MSEX007345 [Manduca sexta]KAG6451774.1 hypothetical protein O3G_MSEX007345 [Manduca sexta]